MSVVSLEEQMRYILNLLDISEEAYIINLLGIQWPALVYVLHVLYGIVRWIS